jgi:hypothetical protein
VLRNLPVALLEESVTQLDRLLAAARAVESDRPKMLSTCAMAEAVDALNSDYGYIRLTSGSLVDTAKRAGLARVTFTAMVPETLADVMGAWLRLVECLDSFAALGELPVPPSTSEVRALRRWVAEEIIRQVREERLVRVCHL